MTFGDAGGAASHPPAPPQPRASGSLFTASMRNKLLVAQAPLALALVGITALAVVQGELHARAERLTLLGAGLALLAGLVLSLRLTTRLLRPLGVLAQTARRFGSGDLEARVRLPGKDELARLADDFNLMATRLAELLRVRETVGTETAAALEAQRSDLVATVAHELKTPLTSLRMALHLLAEGVAGPLAEKQADLIAAGREDCERLQALVDEVLDTSRAQAGRLELDLTAVEPRTLVETVLQAHRSAAHVRGVALEAEVLPSVASLRADHDRLQVALNNLVANAIRHTPAGGRVVLGCRPAAGGVRFDVEDTGPGIPSEFQARVFERFFRVPGGNSSGSGLGLWIVREIARAHGGEAGVESQGGDGSRFWLRLSSPNSEAQ
jgi:signal transduction histidine kinase